MNYSDYFENKVAADFDSVISVVVTSFENGAEVIKEMFTTAKDSVLELLSKYDYYKAEMNSNSITIYTYGSKKV